MAKPRGTQSKSLACEICGKTFSMPAHLGRHKTAIHGETAKTKRARRKGGKSVMFGGKGPRRRPGRPPAIATRFGLSSLSLDELAALINAARDEAAQRIRDFQEMLSQ
jgi:protein-arginine kinase activator protein McsA